LRLAASCGLGGTAAALFERFALTTRALAQAPPSDYKALVCVFLNGGNDANQLIVPLSGAPGFGSADATGGYPAYAAARSAQGLAIAAPPATGTEPADTLLRISAGAANLGPFGMHPRLGLSFSSVSGGVTIPIPSFKSLYDDDRVAVVCNTGTLIRPLTKAEYQAGQGRPDQLFSHSDQIRENQTCIFTGPGGTGWGGRAADQTITLNDPNSGRFPMATSISGAPAFLTGQNQLPLVIAPAPTALNQVLVLNGFGTSAVEVARRNAFNNLRTINRGANKLADGYSDSLDLALSVSAALGIDPQLTVPNPSNPSARVNLTFPNTQLGNQLRQVAKVIKANLLQPALGLRRQIFFVARGGFDTHQNQNATQPNLLQEVGQALATFYYWLQNNAPATGEAALGDLTSKVTAFTLSDFGRTFNPAGSGNIVGSDHAWGSHFLVLGGAVQGGRFYGAAHSNGTVFQTLAMGPGGPDDTVTRGRWIPKVSTLQYANTLAAWYGLAQDAATVDYVFPLLRANFSQTNLGFV
jgi:uncharacterized protein (DUF1501 family)